MLRYACRQPYTVIDMSKQVRVSDETYARLQELADERPLGVIVERAVNEYAARVKPGHHAVPKDAVPDNADHQFRPQKGNALKCANCGQRKGAHR